MYPKGESVRSGLLSNPANSGDVINPKKNVLCAQRFFEFHEEDLQQDSEEIKMVDYCERKEGWGEGKFYERP